MTGFLRRVLSIQGTFDTGHFTAAWSVLFNHVSANNQFQSDRLWCGECGCCIYHAAGNSHARNSSYSVSAINLAGIFGAKVALMTGRDLREQVYEKLMYFSRRMIGSMGSSYADYQGNKRCTAGNPVYYVLIYRDYCSTDDVYRRSCACLVPKREAFGGIACDDTPVAWGFCGIFKADPSLL